jgi:hypothetical protein
VTTRRGKGHQRSPNYFSLARTLNR